MRQRLLQHIAARVDPDRAWRQRIQRRRRPAWLGTLRRTTPLSGEWGFDRGTPVDRYYIERFLDAHRADIHGRVLELRERTYTQRFGQAVTRSDVLDINASNRAATIVADLTSADVIDDDQFDCFILTQTLQFIYDTRAAIQHAHRILRPGGVLLVTVPAISRIAPRYGLESDFWRFSAASCQALFGEVFGVQAVSIGAAGNVLAAIAFLTGMAQEELTHAELDDQDPFYPIIISVRALKLATLTIETQA